MAQAGAYIHCHSSLNGYLKLFQHARDYLLQKEEVQDPDPYVLAVYATWRLSYNKLNGPARSFLQICSMLHHEGIAEEMFEKAALSLKQLEDDELQNEVTQLLNQLGKQDSQWRPAAFQEVAMCLGSYSLIEYDQKNDTYSVHPLVQYWSGTTMDKDKHFMHNCVLSIIGLSVSSTFKNEDYKYRRTLLKHITHAMALAKKSEISPLIASRIALVYDEHGHWNDAEALQVEAIEKRKQMLGDYHPDTLMSMGHLAVIYSKQGRWKDAEALEVEVMEKRKQVLKDDDPYTLSSMENLAIIYSKQGRWKDAEAFEVVVMEKRKEVLGDNHPHTLMSMANLGTTYRKQGRWKDAEALEVVVMEKMKKVLGDDHPDTLSSMANLASTYKDLGCWKDAEALEVVVMEKRKEVLGDDHPNTLSSITNLANTYMNQGHWKDAEELEVVVMEKRDRKSTRLNSSHPVSSRMPSSA